jgi:hypothetical protein
MIGVVMRTSPRPRLDRGERVVATDRDANGCRLVATTLALYRDTEPAWTRLGWEEVSRVSVDSERGLVQLSRWPLDRAATAEASWRAGLEAAPAGSRAGPDVESAPIRWAGVVRELVATTVLATARVRLGTSASALVIARRQPRSTEPHWVVLLDRWLDPQSPVLQDHINAAIRRVRADLGI